MTSKSTSDCKKCRRSVQKLFLKGERCNTPKCALVKRNYPPGMHGVKGAGRLTQYGQQLREKQKVKQIYGIRERQFENYYNKATKKIGNTEDYLILFLEKRLDNVVYRSGFAKSRKQARQLVNHGHFLVNNKKVNIPSYQVKIKDIISINPTKQKSKFFENMEKKLEKYEFPEWINFDPKINTTKIISEPNTEDQKKVFDARLLVEFYSR